MSNNNLAWIEFNRLINDPNKYSQLLTIADLERLLLTLKDYYYNTQEPLVPDYVYDEVEDVLREKYPNSKVLALTDTAISKGPTVKLPYYMHSQSKAKADSGDMPRWLDKYSTNPKLVAHKLDGMSVQFIYDKKITKGSKLKLYSRGQEGINGHDITHIAKYIDLGKYHFPKDIDKVAVRGELIVPNDMWDKHYAATHPHVRNWVAGKINDKHPDKEKEHLKRIRFVTYEVLDPRMKPSDQFEKLKEWGFYTVPYLIADKFLSEDDLKKMLIIAEEKGIYQVDGLVISDDAVYQPPTEKDKKPKYSIAFKMQIEGDEADVIVKHVIWQPSKDMLLKPVVVLLNPVHLSGGTLSRATAHNAKYIIENKIGAGAKITIIRSGKVIPYIKHVVRPAPKPDLPDVEYEWAADKINFKLTKKNLAVYHKVLVHMTKHLGIDHLGPGILQKLVDIGYISPADVLNITLEELQKIDGLGKNADKVFASLEKLKTDGVKLAVLMDASNIFPAGVGTRVLQSVLNIIPNLLELPINQKLKHDLTSIKGIQDKTADKIIEGLPAFNTFLDEIPDIRIKDFDSISSDDTEISGSTVEAFDGMRVVFTGVRDKELEELITRSGGVIANGVNKNHPNQVVVAKDPSVDSNKIKAALNLGVNVYSLAEFRNKYVLI